MITAKDIFVLEQEMAAELIDKVYKAGFSSEEREQIFEEMTEMCEARYDELLRTLSDRITSPLVRVRNGEGLLMRDINKAVRQAANND